MHRVERALGDRVDDRRRLQHFEVDLHSVRIQLGLEVLPKGLALGILEHGELERQRRAGLGLVGIEEPLRLGLVVRGDLQRVDAPR